MNMPHRLSDTDLLHQTAARIGTPYFIYDATILRDRIAQLRAALPAADFFYSLKANPNLSVTRVLREQGVGCEVSSLLELETALAAGAAPGRIILVGPGKSEAELARATRLGIKAIIAESGDEIADIDAMAARQGVVQDVALRINPDFQSGGARLTMSGRATQFGIDQSNLGAVLADLASLRHVRLRGLHVYMGSRILSHEVVAENIRQILALARTVAPQLPAPLEFVDVGGGFGIPYHEGEAELDLIRLGQIATPEIARFTAEHPGTRVVIELGRYIAGPAGRFVTRIRRTKHSKGECFAVCDGGANVHSAAAGQGSFLRKSFPIRLLPARPGSAAEASDDLWHITGPLCTPQDIIGKSVLLGQRPEAGDLICVAQSGAYGPTASPTGFLGFGAPAEVMQDGAELTVVRHRDDVAERLRKQAPVTLGLADPVAAPALHSPDTDEAADLHGTPFADSCLEALAPLGPLFRDTGNRLDRSPDAWVGLCQDPFARALITIGVPEAYNGFPLSDTPLGRDSCPYGLHVAMVERLARFDASSILSMPGPSLSGGAVLAAGSVAQIERFFAAYRTGPQATFFAVTEPEAGSDASNGRTRLRRTAAGLVLNGQKMLVGGAKRADIGLVFCQMEDTGRPVLVMLDPHAAPETVQIDRLPTTGLRGADLCRLTFTDTPVAEDMILSSGDGRSLRDGLMSIGGVFERNRPMVAALALGSGRGILDLLEAKPGLAGRFGALRLGHTALLRQLARVIAAQEAGRPKLAEISRVKMQAVAFAEKVVEAAFESAPAIMLADPELCRRARDVKAFEYMEGTTNIQTLNAYRSYTAGVGK